MGPGVSMLIFYDYPRNRLDDADHTCNTMRKIVVVWSRPHIHSASIVTVSVFVLRNKLQARTNI